MTTRRLLLQLIPAGVGSLLGAAARAEDAVLQEQDSEAKAIEYRTDARQVDVRRYPNYSNGQRCLNCALYTVIDAGSPAGACSIVYGKLVAADGWCASYQRAPA